MREQLPFAADYEDGWGGMKSERASTAGYAGATALAALCQLIFVVDFNSVNVAPPEIGRSLGIDPARLSWVLSAYFLAEAGLPLLSNPGVQFRRAASN